jgi:hypothetical protein
MDNNSLNEFYNLISKIKTYCINNDTDNLQNIIQLFIKNNYTFNYINNFKYMSDKNFRQYIRDNKTNNNKEYINTFFSNNIQEQSGSNKIYNFDLILNKHKLIIENIGFNIAINLLISIATKKLSNIKNKNNKKNNDIITKKQQINNSFDIENYEPITIYYNFNYFYNLKDNDKITIILLSLKIYFENKNNINIVNQKKFIHQSLTNLRNGSKIQSTTIIYSNKYTKYQKYLALYEYCFNRKNISNKKLDVDNNFNDFINELSTIVNNKNNTIKPKKITLKNPIEYYKIIKSIIDDNNNNNNDKINKIKDIRKEISSCTKVNTFLTAKSIIKNYDKNKKILKINYENINNFIIDDDDDKNYIYAKIYQYSIDNVKKIYNIRCQNIRAETASLINNNDNDDNDRNDDNSYDNDSCNYNNDDDNDDNDDNDMSIEILKKRFAETDCEINLLQEINYDVYNKIYLVVCENESNWNNYEYLNNIKDNIFKLINSYNENIKVIDIQTNIIKNPLFKPDKIFKYKNHRHMSVAFYRNKFIKEHPKTLAALILLYMKIHYRIDTIYRNRGDRKEYYKKHDNTEERKKYRQLYAKEFNERQNYYKKMYIDNMTSEEKEDFLEKNAERARKYRTTDEYELYLLQRKLYVDKRKISNLKHVCKKNNIEYNLESDFVQKLIESSCYLCGQEINKEKYIMSYLCRKDTNYGFIKNNVIPLCMICCIMKYNNIKTTIIRAIYIANNLKLINYPKIMKYTDLLYNSVNEKSITYSKYISGAKNRNIQFDLSQDEFDKLTNNSKCHYCGIYYDIIGIDRINSKDNNNKMSYNINNCVSCCKECNMMKRELSYNIFINKCKEIYYYYMKNKNQKK